METLPGKILITTSRNPTQSIRSFCNELARNITNSVRINRGKSSVDALAEKALEHEATKIIIANRWKGGLGKIQFFEIGDAGLVQYYPVIYVKDAKLRKDFGCKGSKIAKFAPFPMAADVSFEVQKLTRALSNFLNISQLTSEEESPTVPQTRMHISLKTGRNIQITFFHMTSKIEVGPRITVSHLVWKSRN